MGRLKKGSAAAKAWGRKMRALRGSHGLSRSSRKARHHSGGKTRNMARRTRRWFGRRRRGGGGKSLTRTAFKLVRLGALVAPGIYEMTVAGRDNATKAKYAILAYTGYDCDAGTWTASMLIRGWGPYLGACLATYGIPKLTSILRKI